MSDKHNFTVGGWSIGKVILNWVKSFEEWNIYNSGLNQVNNVGAKSFVNDNILGINSKSKSQNFINNFEKDIEAGEKDIYDKVVRIEENENINERLFTTLTSKSYQSIYPVMSKQNLMVMLTCLMCVAMSLKRKFQPTSSKQTNQNQLKLMSVDRS